MKKLLTLAALALMAGMITAQNPQWVHFGKFNYITALAEEGDIMWLGTYSGLISFNRKTGEKVYFNSFNSPLPNNNINVIAIESNGTKWIGSDGGLTSFDGTNWVTYTSGNSAMPWILCDRVGLIAIDKNDVKWISSCYLFYPASGITSFDGQLWTTFNQANSALPSDYVRSIAVDHEGLIWAATHDGVGVFDGTVWMTYNSANSELREDCRNICVDKNNTKWFYCLASNSTDHDTAYLTSFNNGIWSNWFVEYPMNQGFSIGSYHFIACDNNGTIWIIIDGKLNSFDGTSFTIFDGPGDWSGIARLLMVDQENVKWLTPSSYYYSDFGLASLDGYDWTLWDFSNSGLPSDNITAIEVQGGKVWIGTNKGLASYDHNGWIRYDEQNSPLTGKEINDISVDKLGYVWVASDEGLAFTNSDIWNIYHSANSGMVHSSVTSVESDSKGNVWIGSYDGLYHFDGANWKLYNDTNSLLPHSNITSVSIDTSGGVWVIDGGYHELTLTTFDVISWNVYMSPLIGNSSVNDLQIDKNGLKWLATDNGVVTFNGLNWHLYDPSNSGMKYPWSNALAFSDNTVWISNWSENYVRGRVPGGLCAFDGTNWTSYDFDQFSPTSIAVDNDGTVWIGTYTGLIAYNANGVPFSITEKPLHKKPLKIYPNPSTSTVTVEAPDDGTLSIFKLNGQLIHEQVVKEGSTSFDVSSLPAGMYVWRFIGGANVQNIKFVKP